MMDTGHDLTIDYNLELTDPVICRSWRRSQAYRIDPEKVTDNELLPSHRLRERLQAHEYLLKAGEQVLPELMRFLPNANYLIHLCDRDGYILTSLGDPPFLSKAQKIHLAPGASWREDVKGTNAIGTAIAENAAVQVLGWEHYVKENHFLACWAAPIRNLAGEPVGILNISGEAGTEPNLLQIAVLFTKLIEQNFQLLGVQKDLCFYRQLLQSSRPPDVGQLPAAPMPVWLGKSKLTRMLYEKAAKAAASNSSILLTGESGTGKEVLANYIHQASCRRSGPFIAINCAALPQNLIESELFGYVDGAFTGARRGGQPGKFELADNGTVFLDEIGDMPLSVQATLLRVLQEREVLRLGDTSSRKINVRIIAASNKDLPRLVAEGLFRLDLFYRLKVITLNLPPLRERLEDIADLAPYFVKKACAEFGKPPLPIADAVYDHLLAYQWPGNIRELENCLTGLAAMSDGPELTLQDLPQELLAKAPPSHRRGQNLLNLRVKQAVVQALRETKGKAAPAARILGMGQSTLYRKIKEFKLDLQEFI